MDWKALPKALEGYSWEVHIQDVTQVYFLAVWLLSVTLIPFIISRLSAPIYIARYTIAASVAFYLLAAKGITNINHKYTKLAVIGIIVVLSMANLQGYYTSITKRQAREATAVIDANFRSGDVILVAPRWETRTFDYYNNRTDVAVKPIGFGFASTTVTNPEAKTKELQSDVNGYQRVWFYDGKISFGSRTAERAAENFILSFLNESYTKIDVKNYVEYDVYLYEKRA